MSDRLPAYADTIVVGAGPAGCALAGRVAAASDESILLLEAGPDYGAFAAGGWPVDLLNAGVIAATHAWGYTSGNLYPDRRIEFQRARVIGGCSSHNGCAAIWGHRADYDGWAALGNIGWSTAELLPFFTSASNTLRVRIPEPAEITPFHQAVLDAAPAIGIPHVVDLNNFDEEIGIAPSPVNIWNHVRWSGSFAYLDPVRERPNLTIAGDCLVDRLIVDRGRVTGVRVFSSRAPRDIRAGRVVLAAGTYGSPAILLRSGIGPADQLRALGVRTVLDLPGVGRNLHDHPSVQLQFAGTPALVARLEQFETGQFLPEEQTIAKLRSTHATEAFDLHLYPVGGRSSRDHSRWEIQVPIACMTPRSRGSLTLISSEPDAAPRLDHGYLTDPGDLDAAVLADGVEIARDLTSQPELRGLLGAPISPAPTIRRREDVLDWIHASVAHYYHPAGTCKMGPGTDSSAVVDSTGKLHGLEGGYVADCSIMPVIPRANTNIPAAVIGERIASLLTRR